MFGNLFKGLKKSYRLQEIIFKLAPKQGGAILLNPLSPEVKARMAEVDQGLEELIAFIKDDPVLLNILNNHKITDQELRDIYFNLQGGGALSANGRWVPAYALTYNVTLSYVLKNKDLDRGQFSQICRRLNQYFANAETGPVE